MTGMFDGVVFDHRTPGKYEFGIGLTVTLTPRAPNTVHIKPVDPVSIPPWFISTLE
jgi:hypothetical protein